MKNLEISKVLHLLLSQERSRFERNVCFSVPPFCCSTTLLVGKILAIGDTSKPDFQEYSLNPQACIITYIYRDTKHVHCYLLYHKQFTIEKIGKAESVTAYDEEFEDLYRKVTSIRANTEKILAQVDNMVQPNPGIGVYI